jgi:hypothetical protein
LVAAVVVDDVLARSEDVVPLRVLPPPDSPAGRSGLVEELEVGETFDVPATGLERLIDQLLEPRELAQG